MPIHIYPNRHHTPGPWSAEKTAVFKGSTKIAEVDGTRGDKQATANAILIAAAPEMLAVLETIYANAAESPEWIRERIGPVFAKINRPIF
jgi:hypothetical protein